MADNPPTSDALAAQRFSRWWAAGAALAACSALAAYAAVAWTRGDPVALWEESIQHYTLGDYPAAAVSLERLARLRTAPPEERMLRAQVKVGLGNYGEAMKELWEIPENSPVAAKGHLLAGQVELRLHHIQTAEEELLRAVKSDPKLIQARRELAYIFGMQMRIHELDEQLRLLQRETHLGFTDAFLWTASKTSGFEPLEAARTLPLWFEADPRNRHSRLAFAELLRRQGKLGEATELLAALPRDDADARAARVRIALSRGDEAAADELLREGPNSHVSLARLRGRRALTKLDAAQAIAEFQIANAAAPGHRETVFGLGVAQRLAGDGDASKRYLAEAARLETIATLTLRLYAPDAASDTALWLKLGAACEAVGRQHEAEAWFRLVASKDALNRDAQDAIYRLKEQSKPKNATAKTRLNVRRLPLAEP